MSGVQKLKTISAQVTSELRGILDLVQWREGVLVAGTGAAGVVVNGEIVVGNPLAEIGGPEFGLGDVVAEAGAVDEEALEAFEEAIINDDFEALGDIAAAENQQQAAAPAPAEQGAAAGVVSNEPLLPVAPEAGAGEQVVNEQVGGAAAVAEGGVQAGAEAAAEGGVQAGAEAVADQELPVEPAEQGGLPEPLVVGEGVEVLVAPEPLVVGEDVEVLAPLDRRRHVLTRLEIRQRLEDAGGDEALGFPVPPHLAEPFTFTLRNGASVALAAQELPHGVSAGGGPGETRPNRGEAGDVMLVSAWAGVEQASSAAQGNNMAASTSAGAPPRTSNAAGGPVAVVDLWPWCKMRDHWHFSTDLVPVDDILRECVRDVIRRLEVEARGARNS